MASTEGRFAFKAHHLVMNVLFLGALAVGCLMLPGVGERVAMLERDGRSSEALALLEARFAAGDRRQRTLHELVGLYEMFGDLANARRTLEMLVGLRPRDDALARRLVQFYRDTNDEAALIGALRASVGARYSEAGCRELVALLRRRGDYNSEREAIEACRQKGYRRSDDLVRLASLLAADGDAPQAAAVLRGADDLRRLNGADERLQLLAILMQVGQPREAARRAVRWLKAQRSDALALEIVDLMVDQSRYDLAIEVVREVASAGDALSLSVAELLLEQDNKVAAAAYLRGWLAQSHDLDAPTIGRFIEAALDAGEPETAYNGADRFGLHRVAEADLVSLAEALAAVGLRGPFERVRVALAAEAFGTQPLLVAAAAVNGGMTDTTIQLLDDLPHDRLEGWRHALWAQLMREAGRQPAPESVLADLVADGGLLGAPDAGPGTVGTTHAAVPRRTARLRRKAHRQRLARPASVRVGQPAPGRRPTPLRKPALGGENGAGGAGGRKPGAAADTRALF